MKTRITVANEFRYASLIKKKPIIFLLIKEIIKFIID